jgi:hypothetical protein
VAAASLARTRGSSTQESHFPLSQDEVIEHPLVRLLRDFDPGMQRQLLPFNCGNSA